MNINIITEAIAELQADVLAWPVTSELEFFDELKGAAGDLLGELVETGETKGKAAELTILHSPLVESIRRHYLIGVGDTLDADSIFKAAGQAVRDALKRAPSETDLPEILTMIRQQGALEFMEDVI